MSLSLKVVELSQPLKTQDNRELTKLSFRRPKGKDLRNLPAGDALGMGMALIPRLCVEQITSDDVDEMDAVDCMTCVNALGEYLAPASK